MSDDTTEYAAPVLALAAHLKVGPETITEEGNGDWYTCESEPGEYRVLTDSEADEQADQYLESYIDDCVLSELPEQYRSYFDSNKFKRDVLLGDGRGPQLASYDGAEEEEQIDGEWYFIYRIG